MTAPNHVKFQETKKVWKKMLLPNLRKGAFYLSFGSFFPFSRSQFKAKAKKKERRENRRKGSGARGGSVTRFDVIASFDGIWTLLDALF